MAVDAVHGRTSLPEGEDRKDIAIKSKRQLYGKPGLYRIFNQIPNRVREKYGATLCRELTKKWSSDWPCREHALHCQEIITDIAGIAADIILSDPGELASRPLAAMWRVLSIKALPKGVKTRQRQM